MTGNLRLPGQLTVVRSQDRQLHDALANHLLDQCEQFLADDGVLYHFTEICE
jgi:hypothetical protein